MISFFPEGWKKSLTNLLMDHLEDNMEKDKENNNCWSNDVNVHVVDRIMNGMDLGNIKNKENCERQISREDIYRAVGVLETNCWEIFGNGKHGFRGIFPLVNQTPCISRFESWLFRERMQSGVPCMEVWATSHRYT